AYTTFAFSSKDDSNAKKMYYYVFNIVAFILLGASFTVSIFGKEIVGLMTEKSYHEAYQTLRDLMFAQTLYAMTTIIGYGIYFAKKSIYSLISVSTGAIVNLGLNLILIPKYGIIAAALTTLIGYTLHYFITMYFSKKVFPCQYGELKVTLVLVCLYVITYFSGELSFKYKIAIWCGCVIVAFILFRKVITDVLKFAKAKLKAKKKKPEEEAVEGEA
ncbi:MAG: polysaccharide biosynthesis C-terminal domain-containing protein, partial [Clostridiales bacterium]|nr:polysaccharide biosynthesis C-terminal domain-containing protein [Clostridiales bacterium]